MIRPARYRGVFRSIKRSLAVGAALALTLMLSGCLGATIEELIAERYPSVGSVVDEVAESGSDVTFEWEGSDNIERHQGSWFLSEDSVPETAEAIVALRRPATMTPPSDEKMALRYDGWSDRVVVLYRATGTSASGSGEQTVIEVLRPQHAYYRHYPFMVSYWGGRSPYYREYGRPHLGRYGYDTVSVGNDGTIRRSTVSSSTRSFRGGGISFGK